MYKKETGKIIGAVAALGFMVKGQIDFTLSDLPALTIPKGVVISAAKKEQSENLTDTIFGWAGTYKPTAGSINGTTSVTVGVINLPIIPSL